MRPICRSYKTYILCIPSNHPYKLASNAFLFQITRCNKAEKMTSHIFSSMLIRCTFRDQVNYPSDLVKHTCEERNLHYDSLWVQLFMFLCFKRTLRVPLGHVERSSWVGKLIPDTSFFYIFITLVCLITLKCFIYFLSIDYLSL